MLYRYETEYLGRHIQPTGSLSRFSDGAGVHTAARDAMRWAVGAGLIQGTSDNALRPGDYASRAHLDTILRRYGQALTDMRAPPLSRGRSFAFMMQFPLPGLSIASRPAGQ